MVARASRRIRTPASCMASGSMRAVGVHSRSGACTSGGAPPTRQARRAAPCRSSRVGASRAVRARRPWRRCSVAPTAWLRRARHGAGRLGCHACAEGRLSVSGAAPPSGERRQRGGARDATRVATVAATAAALAVGGSGAQLRRVRLRGAAHAAAGTARGRLNGEQRDAHGDVHSLSERTSACACARNHVGRGRSNPSVSSIVRKQMQSARAREPTWTQLEREHNCNAMSANCNEVIIFSFKLRALTN
jgi:hypothetical protein